MNALKRRLFSLLLSLCLLAAFAVPAFAAGQAYTYTVRLYSGGQGTFGGREFVEYAGLHYGDRVTFTRASVTLEDDSKYYVKGIRESGRDNNTVGRTSFLVTQDQDYVVAYGILGDSVAYTVNYVDESGNTLAPSETYHGNIGDKPVIGYRFIDGYEPQYYNLTRTLSANAAENVFDFVYRPVSGGSSAPYSPDGGSSAPVVIVIPGGRNPGEPSAPPAAPGGGESEPGTPNTPGTSGGETPEPSSGPEEILDLDTPLATLNGSGSDSDMTRSSLPEWIEQHPAGAAAIGGLIVLMAALIIALILLRKRKKNDEQHP